MKLTKRIIGFALLSVMLVSVAFTTCACATNKSGTKITFASWGNETEQTIFTQLVKQFNEENSDIEVTYTPIPTADYQTKINNNMRGSNTFDVFVAGDGEIKPWIEAGYIEPMDDYLASSTALSLDKMWQEGISRYRYDVTSRKSGTGNLYGIMRDYSTSAVYYNKDAFAAVGIECISMTAEQSLATYGDNTAFFTYNGKKYFNNQVAMDWNEFLELSCLTTSNAEAPVRNNASITKYGVYVSNWFCFGRTLGADNLEWVTDSSLSTGGKYVFTMFDDSPNWIVQEGIVTIGSKAYQVGETIEYEDKAKLTDADKAKCGQLPSHLDGVQYYVDLSVSHKVSPKPDVTGSNSNYGMFASKQVAMLLDTRYAVGIFRKTVTDFDWDVAPLPVYKEYNDDGSIKVSGVQAGHSGSEAICVSSKSKKKNAAWKFVEYLCGEVGQKTFAEAGFTVPNTMELANSEVFLQSNQKPANAKVFADAAYYQTVGDWGYLPSKAWINEWANDFNADVLAGLMTLSALKTATQAATQGVIDNYYK